MVGLHQASGPKGEPFAASRLHWRAGPLRSFTAIRKEAGLFCGSVLRKGLVFACVGLIQTPKDLKWPNDTERCTLTHLRSLLMVDEIRIYYIQVTLVVVHNGHCFWLLGDQISNSRTSTIQ